MDLASARAIVMDTGRPRRGRPRGSGILSREDRRAMMERFRAGEDLLDLAKAFGVSRATAYAICANAAVMEG